MSTEKPLLIKVNKDGHLPRLEDGRIKIPTIFADYMLNSQTGRPYNRSTIVRVNQGERELSLDAAVQVVDIFKQLGFRIHITDILPGLDRVRPYLCKRNTQ